MSLNIKGRKHLMETLTSLGLTKDEAYIYIHIMQNPAQTLLGISKIVQMGRSKTENIIDILKEKNLINEVPKDKGAIYFSQSYANIKNLVESKEKELHEISENLDSLKDLFKQTEDNKKKNGIVTYHGETGLKQVIWNTTKAKNVLKVFEVSRMNVFLDFGFSESVRRQYLANKIKTKDLTNESFVQGWTNITEFAQEYAQCRYIDPDEISVSCEIYIYNDVVAMLDYSDNKNILCLEIYNPQLKGILETLFDYVWAKAKLMKITGPRGQQEVIE